MNNLVHFIIWCARCGHNLVGTVKYSYCQQTLYMPVNCINWINILNIIFHQQGASTFSKGSVDIYYQEASLLACFNAAEYSWPVNKSGSVLSGLEP